MHQRTRTLRCARALKSGLTLNLLEVQYSGSLAIHLGNVAFVLHLDNPSRPHLVLPPGTYAPSLHHG